MEPPAAPILHSTSPLKEDPQHLAFDSQPWKLLLVVVERASASGLDTADAHNAYWEIDQIYL